MSLIERKPKSDAATLFVQALTRDKYGRPTTVIVPGTQGKRYHVIIRRFDNALITVECRLIAGRCGFLGCPGNGPRKGKETICYHSRAAVNFALKEVKMTGSWCESLSDAKRLSHLGGVIFKVKSHQNRTGVAYLVVKEI